MALVLVPVVMLGWLATQAADAFDAAEDAQVRATVARGMEVARAAVAKELALLEGEVQQALADSAAYVRERVPIDGIGPAMEAARKRIWFVGLDQGPPVRAGWRGDLKLIDARGRGLDPIEHVPEDAFDTGAVAPGFDVLFADLSRRADAAYYGEGLEAALAVWDEAKDGFASPLNQARCDVEHARLEVRAADRAKSLSLAQDKAKALEADHGLSRLIEIGRPAVLLWMSAMRTDRLYQLLMDGRVDRVPLTDLERAHVIDLIRNEAPGTRGNHPLDMRVWPGSSFNGAYPVHLTVDVAGGARLELWIHQVQIWNALYHRVRDAWDMAEIDFGLGTRHVIPFSDGTVVQYPQRIFKQHDFVSGPAGSLGVLAVAYRDWPEIVQGRQTRRVVIYAVVGVLLLLTLGGFFFLRRAARRERDARRLRDDFIANVTHEVRTPLTSVLMHAEMLADDELDAERKQTYARVVHAEGARLARLVEDMLDFTALEKGSRALEAVPLDLTGAAEHAIEPFRVLAEREGVALAFERPDDEVAALGDAGAVSRILANLVGNAWKHGRPSRDGAPGRLRVRVGLLDDVPFVEVRDDGPGIPAAERGRVFERFGRGRAADTKDGAGLGLALSRDLARAMGGDLVVQQDGVETVFRLHLKAMSGIMGG
ncbi:MAG: HAMP domain-containing sensor histidine kinase [Planctomycetota bacterium]|nr:HAMP domain-containing sensor histidine kinase [Planctomycetota bacterium]